MRTLEAEPTPHPVEVLSLEENLLQKRAAWERQTRRLREIEATWDAEKLTCSSSKYSSLRDEIEQVSAIVASLKAEMDHAEENCAQHMFAEQRTRRILAARESRNALMEELTRVDKELITLDFTYREIPNKMRQMQGRRSSILLELANLKEVA